MGVQLASGKRRSVETWFLAYSWRPVRVAASIIFLICFGVIMGRVLSRAPLSSVLSSWVDICQWGAYWAGVW